MFSDRKFAKKAFRPDTSTNIAFILRCNFFFNLEPNKKLQTNSKPPTMDTALQKIMDLAELEYRPCAGLPFAVYLVSREGVFLKYNEEAQAFFGLPAEPDFQHRVTDFYNQPGDREDYLSRLGRLERGQWLKNTTIDLKVNGQMRFVRDYTKAVWSEDGQSTHPSRAASAPRAGGLRRLRRATRDP